MTSRWSPEGGQHRMLTSSVMLQCICIVKVEACNQNSKTTKNKFSTHFCLTHFPASLTVSFTLLPHSLPSLAPHSVPTLSYSFTLLTPMYPCSLIHHSLPHSPASLTPFLTHAASLTHSSHSCLTPLPDSLFHSFSVSLTSLLLTS